MGAVSGGGIYVNGYGDYLEISNNRIINNQGTFGGGITVGTSDAFAAIPNPDSFNDAVNIHHNMIAKNGGINGGGGVTILTGADNYTLADNLICGNFTRSVGAVVAHIGVSDGGTIARNQIVFNEVFYGGEIGGNGGGIFIGGAGANPGAPGGLDAGSGSVSVVSNLIQGNLAGSGSGGGIQALRVNGQDVEGASAGWYSLNIFNNMIINNVAAHHGGGIALQDAARVSIIHNTIVNNDATATAAQAFAPGNLTRSSPQGAGITAAAHSPELASVTGQAFSNPDLANNIIWHNRSFYWDGTRNDSKGELVPNSPPYWDLQVVGEGAMEPQYCILSSTTGFPATNVSTDPALVTEYNNNLSTAALLQEGGNFITVRHTNLTISAGDYHIGSVSPAIDAGTGAFSGVFPALATDIDGETRPLGEGFDIGADEVPVAAGP